MRKIIFSFIVLGVFVGVTYADLYQSNNPFPSQINPQCLNNIYETKPEIIQNELKAQKKSRWKLKEDKIKNSKQETPEYNEGIQEYNGFYVFTNPQNR